jgi:PhzF family phenazine biosynthesis protein
MQVKLVIANAFSIEDTGGNPAGIVLDADLLSREQKQLIAKKAGLSETAFVSRSTTADFKLEFFTPNRQIAHCGHATIATFTYLRKIGRIGSDQSSKETIDGTRKIFYQEGEAYMEQFAPTIIDIKDLDEISSSLGGTVPMRASAVNTGNTFILIALKNQSELKNVKPDDEKIRRISEKFSAIGYYVFTTEGLPSSLDATARMFGPLYGIREESGTGMAAGPLACLLFLDGLKKKNYFIEQGKFMQPPSRSLIRVTLETAEGKIQRLYAGGDAYISSEKLIRI